MSLKFCSLAAKGLWIEMLSVMGISEKVGYLQLGGKPITIEQLAIMVGTSIEEVKSCLKELEDNGVFSRDNNGIPYSRRMAREADEFNKAREYGLKGGNPVLKNFTHKPEATSQKLEAREGLRGGDKTPLKGVERDKTVTSRDTESNLEDSEKKKETLPPTPSPLDLDFEEAWKLYPDKSGKEKAHIAYCKWRKSGDTKNEIMDGLIRYVDYVRRRQATDFKDLKFKNGATWFNQRGWKDEYTMIAKVKPRITA